MPSTPNSPAGTSKNIDVPHVKLLAVLVADSGFQRFRTIAAAVAQEDLQRHLSQWLMDETNKRVYLGRYQITVVPYVGAL